MILYYIGLLIQLMIHDSHDDKGILHDVQYINSCAVENFANKTNSANCVNNITNNTDSANNKQP